MRRNGEAFSAEEVVGVGAAIAVRRGFLEILGELLGCLRFRGASLCFFDFLSRCLGGEVESIVRFGCGGEFDGVFFSFSPVTTAGCGGRVTCTPTKSIQPRRSPRQDE